MPVCPVCRSQNMETAKFCGNCGNPFPRMSETTSSLRKCEQGHIYSAVYQACPYCPQGVEVKREAPSFETRIEEIPSFVEVPLARPAVPEFPDFATRIDAPTAPNLPPPPGFSLVSENDLATRLETPMPSEFVTRIEAPIPSEFMTRIEQPPPTSKWATSLEPPPASEWATQLEDPPAPPTYDLLGALGDKASVAAPPAQAPEVLPRTELFRDEPIFSTRFDHPQVPASVLDLNWPTPPPANAPTLQPLPAPADSRPFARTAEQTGSLNPGEAAAAPPPLPATPSFVVAPVPVAPAASQGPNRGTMVLAAEDAKKSLGSKGKLVGWLVSYGRNPDGEDFKLYAGYNRMGANPACDIVVEDDTVSGSHAIIVFRDGRFLVKDDLSRNGTFINGKEITEAHPLQSYDQVRVGNTTLVFVAAQKL